MCNLIFIDSININLINRRDLVSAVAFPNSSDNNICIYTILFYNISGKTVAYAEVIDIRGLVSLWWFPITNGVFTPGMYWSILLLAIRLSAFPLRIVTTRPVAG